MNTLQNAALKLDENLKKLNLFNSLPFHPFYV